MQKRNGHIQSWGIALLMLVLLLSACGKNSDVKQDASSPTAAATLESTTSPAETTAPTETTPATKVVTTLHGDIEIPVKPLRIVTDDYLGSLIALGVKPIGTPGLHLKNLYFAEALAGVEDIGDYGNSSMEKIIDLHPDLIITAEDDEAKYNVLAKAAPTISVPYGELKNAHEELTYFGKLLGREAEAAAWLADYDDRIAKAKAKVDKAIPADATFTIFEDGEKSVYTYGDNFGRGGQPIYQALGRKPPAGIADEIMKKQWKELSMEMLASYAGDYLIITSNSRTLDDFKKDPVWSTLEAVKNDRVYVWKEERSWYYDPIAVLSQTEELAAWLSGEK
ncbi:ABC transporter substrate-binding protein [Paenibacillus eucommiae]|uniref:Iron complex transport system substrate-binding protein n=1 Tax=Paenibacillus eucommiae TaxID=1355755 RepID=A0ABS4J9L7_9BACL|nr:ABC transporter substrate-binding protein [Paenibacillus eucommiae]MBP1996548.1 iron complex transport system substrate-binding protein [Paenibacillus eucommiae]